MSFFNLFKSKEEKLNEAVREDLALWRVWCTGIAASDAFFEEYPPKEMYMNLLVQKAWLFAAVNTVLNIVASKDQKLYDVVLEHIFNRIEEDDKNASEKICPKVDALLDVYGDITKNLKTQIEYVQSIMQRIDAPSVYNATAWMFCKSFLELITEPDEKIDFNKGADFLYNHFMGLIATSETIKVYESCFKK